MAKYSWSRNFTFENLSGIEIDSTVANPTILSCGAGRDSVAMLAFIEQPEKARQWLAARGRDPALVDRWVGKIDAVVFADPGNERAATYALIPKIAAWCSDRNLPFIVVRRWSPNHGSESLGDSLKRNGTIPLMPQSHHTCSLKFKVDPQQWFVDYAFGGVVTKPSNRVRGDHPSMPKITIDHMVDGYTATFLVGINADETKRTQGGAFTMALDGTHATAFPLLDMGITRSDEDDILDNFAPEFGTVKKSSCVFCPFMRECEIAEVVNEEPESWAYVEDLEARFRETSPIAAASGRWGRDSYAAGIRLFWSFGKMVSKNGEETKYESPSTIDLGNRVRLAGIKDEPKPRSRSRASRRRRFANRAAATEPRHHAQTALFDF